MKFLPKSDWNGQFQTIRILSAYSMSYDDEWVDVFEWLHPSRLYGQGLYGCGHLLAISCNRIMAHLSRLLRRLRRWRRAVFHWSLNRRRYPKHSPSIHSFLIPICNQFFFSFFFSINIILILIFFIHFFN